MLLQPRLQESADEALRREEAGLSVAWKSSQNLHPIC